MLIYVILTFFYLVCIFIESTLKLTLKRLHPNFWIIFLVTPLFIFAAFRDISVGNDTFPYYRAYQSISQENLFAASDSRFEIGYVYLVRLLGMLGFDYIGFQIVTTFFIYYVF